MSGSGEAATGGLLNRLIGFSLRHRAAVLMGALLVVLAGANTLTELPV